MFRVWQTTILIACKHHSIRNEACMPSRRGLAALLQLRADVLRTDEKIAIDSGNWPTGN